MALRTAAGSTPVEADGDVETAGYSDDEVFALAAACTRISLLLQYHDLGPALEDDDGGKASSGWSILLALAGRGSLGYREETQVSGLDCCARTVF